MHITNMDNILLSHGGGGKKTQVLLKEVFLQSFGAGELSKLDDGAIFDSYVISTDSYVVSPLFFPGGDIGKLAASGSINDVVSMGAEPLYMSAGFIIEEGFPVSELKRIVKSLADTIKSIGVELITGDTKVVEKGKCDGVYINTTGIGRVVKELSAERIRPGNLVVINGNIAEHGLSILLARNEYGISSEIKSDCMELWTLIRPTLELDIRFMRDATRGGLAAVLNEVVSNDWGIELYQDKIPISEEVKGMCEMLGLDPLTVANEGKMVIFVSEDDVEKLIEILRKHPGGKNAEVIGRVVDDVKGRVVEKTVVGTRRIVDMPVGEGLPRIC